MESYHHNIWEENEKAKKKGRIWRKSEQNGVSQRQSVFEPYQNEKKRPRYTTNLQLLKMKRRRIGVQVGSGSALCSAMKEIQKNKPKPEKNERRKEICMEWEIKEKTMMEEKL